MKKTITAIILALVAVGALTLSVYGIAAITTDLKETPLVSIEDIEPELIREVYAWYYEDGIVEDEWGQLWYWDTVDLDTDEIIKLWISDNKTATDYTDDIVVDYEGG